MKREPSKLTTVSVTGNSTGKAMLGDADCQSWFASPVLDSCVFMIPSPEVTKTLTERSNLALIFFKTRAVLRSHKPAGVYEGNETLREQLPTLAFYNASAISMIYTKCAVNPRRVLDMWVHRALAYFPGFGHSKASADEAILIHYRLASDEWQYDVPQRLLGYGKFETWDYPRHLQRRLYLHVKERLDRVYVSRKHKIST
ncbi:hypothetical protein Y032_0095g2824 [Ancylostoma ceylanicum]|nr:hypothetical protein Y032_0095g2824 [Ancylostoma ceylanicum]